MQAAIQPIAHRNRESAAVLSANAANLLQARIMMVDDEPITMEVVQTFLEDAGYRHFMLVDDPRKALRILEEQRPDLLLLDLKMPEISGFDILQTLRADDRFRHLPVLILSSSSDNADKLRALDLGATDLLSKPVDPSELQLRVRNTLAAKAYMDQLAYYDPLTKLPNRYLFLEQLEWSLEGVKRSRDKLALLSIELDQFDKINDTLGLYAGDDVLRDLAARIVQEVRQPGLPEHSGLDDDTTASLFHIEGGVFALILCRLQRERDAALVAGRLLEAVKQPMQIGQTELYFTASIGISTYPTEDVSSVGLLQLASAARDHAKSSGGNMFQFSSRQINVKYQKRLSLEARLRRALEREEFVLHYQPKLDVATSTITGVEALLRWQVKDRGLVPLHHFIPIAEETELIVPIGEWVLAEACRQLEIWRQKGLAPIDMAVNLSPSQFQNPEMLRAFREIITASRIDPQCLILEVTESVLLEDADAGIETMNRLKEIGLRLAIDDFGTGYSSLSYLKRLPLDEIKIDRSFFVDLFEDSKSRALVSALIHLARSMGLVAVAEGVESEAQLRFLQNEGCDQYQGYLFSPPRPMHELMMLLPGVVP
ncbi:MAG: EAL domain-containing protein [Desulfobacterales bacterium]|nr:EAL domain-containing protein [Desulfobacterales bacterium]